MVKLVSFDLNYLELSWRWLNDIEIKRLTDASDFTKEEQLIWYKNLKEKKDYMIWGIEYNKIPVGSCGLKSITELDCEYWGYIGEKEYWGKGIGKTIIDRMIVEAKKLQLVSIWLKVVNDNKRAIKLYERKGFLTINENHDALFMRKML
ncbi:GNAT family N-acetyltransferase [Saccharicrinis sp. FJH54]|uniref:GNAT family N-acetyltransferase n=1 Tax=Saccharicrinis sp. FJH54 TaxID=3344665 RepID=UPI0035D4A1CA